MTRSLLTRSCTVALVVLLKSAAFAAEAEPMVAVENAATEWVKMRAETVRVQDEWDAERGLLASTVQGFKERAEKLEAERDHLRAKTAEERDEIETLANKKEVGAADLAAAEGKLKALDLKLQALRPRLPPRLAEALELSFRSLTNPELSPGERMQLTMTVLNRCAQFNGTVNAGEEVLQFDGEPAPQAVEVIYWGLSHGYALDRATGKAWFGAPGAERWTWTANPAAVAPVEKLIAIYYDKHDPELVLVPARLAGLQP
jgi:hypothetical protein